MATSKGLASTIEELSDKERLDILNNQSKLSLYYDRLDTLEKLTNEEIGEIFRALIFERDKWRAGEMPTFTDRIIDISFEHIIKGIRISDDEYIKKTLKNRENGDRHKPNRGE